MASILNPLFCLLIAVLTLLCRPLNAPVVPLEVVTPEGNSSERRISPDLFDSLQELAHVVDVSYCIGTTGIRKPFQCLSHCNELKGFELVTTWHTGPFLSDSCGYIALSHHPSPKRIIVAFRGTYSITNTIVDLSAYPQEYVPYPAGNDSDTDDNPRKCSDCFVHAGFMNAWQITRSTILEAISAARDEYPDYELSLVGHSLGGAVAALAGTEMKLRGWDPVITTFGEPMVGNKAFTEYLDAVFDLDSGDASEWAFRRVTHVNDPVPLLPLKEWGYEMHGGEIYISRADLPFYIDDVVYCEGRHDQRCIAAAEGEIQSDPTASSFHRLHDIGSLGDVQVQHVLSDPTESTLDQEARPPDSELGVAAHLPWHLVPPRFRLWELFNSHRDYFLRLGVCVPGGDPTGRW
ncbi:lipase family protein [Aspergillus lucknowensis]|uniref:feruloyl esterase n=1 Tax=Aspergillus lucknowensis TaxID=176173 RepID=A0ABR4LJ41_9EURO